MHPAFLDCLRCPATGQPLELVAERMGAAGQVETGRLNAPGGRVYPIRGGVPRFVPQEAYSGSFGFEWQRWPRVQFEAENAGQPMAGATRAMWERITGWPDADIRGRILADFGCGPGRVLDIVRGKGARAVGLDMSLAVEAARKNFRDDPEVLIVQGDLLQPPFAPGTFAAGFSFGVLHHTPDPAAGVAALARVIAPGGRIACSVYRRGGFYDLPSVHRTRRWQRRLAARLGHGPAVAYAYASAYGLYPLHGALYKLRLGRLAEWLYRNAWVVVEFPDARWRVLDTFDAITPAIATCHAPEEVRAWLAAAGCVDIQPSQWNSTALTARIPAVQSAPAAACLR